MKTKINIDKIRLCLQQPENFYDTLFKDLNQSTDNKVFYDGFFLSVKDAEHVNDKDITATLFIIDKTPIELGTFTFNKSRKYGTKCFFAYNTKCLYETVGYVPEGKGFRKYNYFNFPFLVFWRMGLVFNNVTSVEIACDTEASVIKRIQYAVSHPELFYMILLRKNVDDPEAILEGYWEYYQRSRVRKAARPSLYIHPAYIDSSSAGSRCELKVYDKARELAQVREDKEVLTRAWNDMQGNIQRLEVRVENKKFRQFFAKMNKLYPDRWLQRSETSTTREQHKELYRQGLEHFFFDIGMDEGLRCEMFDYFANNLLHFKLHDRDKTQVSILDLCVNNIDTLKGCVKRKRGNPSHLGNGISQNRK